MSAEDSLVAVLQRDYDAALGMFRQLVDTRFKLLALVPIATGIAVQQPDEHGSIALLGLAVTIGVIVYEIRNSQLHDNTVHRLRWLEDEMKLPSSVAASKSGGLITDSRSGAPLRVGGVRVVHDRALALVYGVVVGAWMYRLSWSQSAHLWTSARPWGAKSAGAIAALTTAFVIVRTSQRGRVARPLDQLLGGASGRASPSDVAALVPDLDAVVAEAGASRRVPRTKAVDTADRLGLIEVRRALALRRRAQAMTDPPSHADESRRRSHPLVGRRRYQADWWTVGRIEDSIIRRPLLPWRAMTHLRESTTVRIRPTPWGELWTAHPAPNSTSSRERAALLEAHLVRRVAGLAELVAALGAATSDGWLTESQITDAVDGPERRTSELSAQLTLLRRAGVVERGASPGGERYRLIEWHPRPVVDRSEPIVVDTDHVTFFEVASSAPV